VSRRQHTTLILQVRIPVPAGKTQAATHEWVKKILTGEWTPGLATMVSPQVQVKITGRETVYL
jgi:hypothetical protein